MAPVEGRRCRAVRQAGPTSALRARHFARQTKLYATIEGYAFATDPCGAGLCEDQNLDELAAVTDATPVSVCLDAASWDDYTGGVLRADSCSSAYIDVDHCVQLVGYDKGAAEPYWKIRNSWGTDWGEGGFIRLAFGNENMCCVGCEAMSISATSAAAVEA